MKDVCLHGVKEKIVSEAWVYFKFWKSGGRDGFKILICLSSGRRTTQRVSILEDMLELFLVLVELGKESTLSKFL